MWIAVRYDKGSLAQVVGPFDSREAAYDWIENSGQPTNPDMWDVQQVDEPIL